MNEIIYLENDEEITSVIDRLRKAKENSLALVIPRGGSLAQSIVNLKLLKRSAQEMGKEISLVSTDRISRNLASQIGLTVFSKAAEAEKALPMKKDITPVEESGGDFKVNSYYGKDKDIDSEIDHEQNELLNEAMNTEDLEDEEVQENQDDENDDESEKIEKEDIDKAYKSPEQNPKSDPVIRQVGISNDRAEIRNPKEGGHPMAGPDSDSGPIKKREDNDHSRGDKMKKPMSRNKKIAIGIIAGCVVLLLAVAYVFLPYASVKVLVKTEELSLTEKVIISPVVTAINQEGLVIPATIVELEKEISKTYKTTGTKEMGEKATGKITISNLYNLDPVAFPKGTKFTSGDKSFVSMADVTVPGETVDVLNQKFVAGTADVLVEAENASSQYNLGPSDFIIEGLTSQKQGRITGHSASAMTGGTTKAINIVSDADFKSAEADLTKSIADLGKTELAAKAKDEKLEIIEAKITSELLSKEASKNLNDEADSFDYRVKIKLSVLAYDPIDIKTVLTTSAEKGLTSDKMLIGQDKFEISTEYIGDVKAVEAGTESGAVEVNSALKGRTGQKLSDKEIKAKIKGKKYAEAKTIIAKYDRVESVIVDIWPSSIARVPMLTSRIKVTFDYAN